MSYESVYLIMLGAFGLVFGSFANVVIWRFPRGESVVKPRSRCPSCGYEIRWYDNIPVFSWIALRASCRDCGEHISVRYPLVEAISGVIFVLAGVRFGVSIQALVAVFFFYLLLILAFIDLDTMRLPNPLVLVLAVGGLLAVVIAQFSSVEVAPLIGVAADGRLASPLVVALMGVLLGVAPSLLIAVVYGVLRGRSGLGMGDVKLLAAMGPFLGAYVLFVFFAGSILGTLIGVPVMLRTSGRGERARAKMPFGPFLALAGVMAVLVGPAIFEWYVGLVGL